MNDLQELLKDLKDIHEPEAISNWPPAIGWWLLPVVIIIAIILIIWLWKRARRPNYKKLAYKNLKNIINNYEIQRNDKETVGEVSLLIRQVMVAKFGNKEVAGLIESEWLMKLDAISRSNMFSEGAGKVIVVGPYALDCDMDVPQLFEATKKLLGRL